MTSSMRIMMVFFVICHCFTSNAQEPIVLNPPLQDSIYFAEPKTGYFIDSTNSMDIRDVLRHHFVPTSNPLKGLEKYNEENVTEWLRWRLINPTTEKKELVLLFHRISIFSLYSVDSNGIHFLKGRPPFYTSETKNQRRSSIISLPGGSTVDLYAKTVYPSRNIVNGYPILVDAGIWKTDTVKLLYDKRYIVFVDITFMAIVLFIIIHTLALYSFNRLKVFLLYALYGAVVLMYFLFKFDETNYLDTTFAYFPYVHKDANIPLSYLMYFAYYRFVRTFINFKDIAPWFYKTIIVTERILIASIVVDLAFIFLHLFEARATLFDVLRCYLLIAGFTGIFLLFRSGSRQAYFIATGSCFLLIGALASMILTWLTPGGYKGIGALFYMKLGVVTELLCFTLGLSYKSSLVEREKIIAQQQLILQLEENKKLQEEMTTKLETRVQKQMKEILAQQELLEKEKEQQLTLEFRKRLTEMELQVLKSQLNPHFYFNTLNNLYGLTIIDPKKAPNAILKLSDIMEYVIYDCKSEKVPLDKELKFISSYMELEKLRYEDSIHIMLKMEGSCHDKFISPMLLIQFIENAFKHGMEQNKTDSYLQVSIIVGTNDLTYRSINSMKEKNPNSNGVGLANVQKRLKMLYPGRHSLSLHENGSEFQVELYLEL